MQNLNPSDMVFVRKMLKKIAKLTPKDDGSFTRDEIERANEVQIWIKNAMNINYLSLREEMRREGAKMPDTTPEMVEEERKVLMSLLVEVNKRTRSWISRIQSFLGFSVTEKEMGLVDGIPNDDFSGPKGFLASAEADDGETTARRGPWNPNQYPRTEGSSDFTLGRRR